MPAGKARRTAASAGGGRFERPDAHEERVEAARGEEADEPGVVVERPHERDHEAAPREEAARERRDDGGGFHPP